MSNDASPEPDEPAESTGPAERPGRSRRDPVQVVGLVVLVVGALVVAAALVQWARGDSDPEESQGGSASTDCIPADDDRDAVPPPPTDPGRRHAAGRTPPCGFGEVAVRITDSSGRAREWCMLAAVTEAQRNRGLMEVHDPELGGYDGMIFLYDEPRTGGFYMRNTPMPLSIAYFDTTGRFISAADMAPCGDQGGCPTYPAPSPFRAAIEVPKGGLDELGIGEGSTLQVGEACPPKDPA